MLSIAYNPATIEYQKTFLVNFGFEVVKNDILATMPVFVVNMPNGWRCWMWDNKQQFYCNKNQSKFFVDYLDPLKTYQLCPP